MKTRIIGDVHGDMGTYLAIIKGVESSIQVGDFGIGFIVNPVDFYDTQKHHFIRGNHDYPHGCREWEPNYIPDGTVRDNVMFVGGAYSIDWQFRTPGRSWWSDEECSQAQFDHFIEVYSQVKPDVMITHELPDMIADVLCRDFNKPKFSDGSITRDAFDAMFKIHQPKFWFAGHWHVAWEKNIMGTNFRVLDINEYVDFDFETLEYV